MSDAIEVADCTSLPLTSVKLAYIIDREHNVDKSNKSHAIKSSTNHSHLLFGFGQIA